MKTKSQDDSCSIEVRFDEESRKKLDVFTGSLSRFVDLLLRELSELGFQVSDTPLGDTECNAKPKERKTMKTKIVILDELRALMAIAQAGGWKIEKASMSMPSHKPEIELTISRAATSDDSNENIRSLEALAEKLRMLRATEIA